MEKNVIEYKWVNILKFEIVSYFNFLNIELM